MKDEPTWQNPQNDVEHRLEALARIQVPEGMHDRLAAGLRQHESLRTAQRQSRSGSRLWPVSLAVALLALAVTYGSLWQRRTGSSARPSLAASSQSTQHRSLRPQPQPRKAVHSALGARMNPKLAMAPARVPREPLPVAVSYPAPPAPLTHQERLLLQIAELRSPPAVEALGHAVPVNLPGNRLPDLSVTVPGSRLPTMAAEAPGDPLPDLYTAINTGDQP